VLFSELRESSVAEEETSLLGDGGTTLLYGSAGCIIAPDGGMFALISALLWEAGRWGVYLCGDDSGKREKLPKICGITKFRSRRIYRFLCS